MHCRAKCKKYDQQSTMEATLERLESALPGGGEPGSPDAAVPAPPNPAVTPETPSQSLGYRLANAGLNSVPTGVGLYS